MRVKIVIKYDGSKFLGFQRQNTGRTVQKEIEKALKKIYKKQILIHGAGRTDALVHANGQVIHFDIPKENRNLKNELNKILMPDIIVRKINEVKDDFDARRDVKKKEYIYKINLGPFQTSLNNYFLQPRYKLDISLMKDASKYLLGTHDFRNFVSGKRVNYETTIYSIEFVKFMNKLEIRFKGVGFYRYMVRNMVGALIEVGKCKESYLVIKDMIEKPKEKKVLPTAPPEGLYLNKIWY